jgi:hypothetical protein
MPFLPIGAAIPLGQARPHRVQQLRALAVEDQADTMEDHRALLLRSWACGLPENRRRTG